MDESGDFAGGIYINDQLNAVAGVQPMDAIFSNNQTFITIPVVVGGPEPEMFLQIEDELQGIMAMEGSDEGGIEHGRNTFPEV